MQIQSMKEIFGDMPKVVLLLKEFLPTEREVVMAAYAFMHCSLFTGPGDIELAAGGEAVRTIKRTEMPDDFEAFYAMYRKAGADGFHARCAVPGTTLAAPLSVLSGGRRETHLYSLISRSYNFVYDLMCGADGAALFHPGFDEDADVYERIQNETISNIKKLQRGEPIRPNRKK